MVHIQLNHCLAIIFSSFLMAFPVLAVQDFAPCQVQDFDPFWPWAHEIYLAQELSGNEESPSKDSDDLHQALASIETRKAVFNFSLLLQKYPALCGLKRLKNDKFTRGTFVTLVYRQNLLQQAFERGQISPEYLSATAVSDPLFTTNLLGHLGLLIEITHTLEINEEQRKYFSRIAKALISGGDISNEALLVYTQAFTHLVLLINEGRADEWLARYSEMIIGLRDDQYQQFLQLELTSTAGIDSFISIYEKVGGDECRWVFFGEHNSQKIWTCGNMAFSRSVNGSLNSWMPKNEE